MIFYRFYPFTTGQVVTPPAPTPAPFIPPASVGGERRSRPRLGVPRRTRLEELHEQFLERIALENKLNTPEEIKVVTQVAIRQAEDLRQDEPQRTEELYRELAAEEIEMRAAHLEALASIRERLIEIEIGRLLREKLNREEEELLMLAAVSVAIYLT